MINQTEFKSIMMDIFSKMYPLIGKNRYQRMEDRYQAVFGRYTYFSYGLENNLSHESSVNAAARDICKILDQVTYDCKTDPVNNKDLLELIVKVKAMIQDDFLALSKADASVDASSKATKLTYGS